MQRIFIYHLMSLKIFILNGLFVFLVAENNMSFMDVLELKYPGSPAISPNGGLILYTVNEMNWEENNRYNSIYLSSTDGETSQRMTFTDDQSESNPKWVPDGKSYIYISSRDNGRQLYHMHIDGGEGKKITNHQGGVSVYRWNDEGSKLAYLAGPSERRQLHIMERSLKDNDKITEHDTGIRSFQWSSDGKKILFTAPDSLDAMRQERQQHGFDIRIMDEPEYPLNVWKIDIQTKETRKLTNFTNYSARSIEVSNDGRWIGILGQSTDRYAQLIDREIFLYDLKTDEISRITYSDVGKSSLSFSPDSRYLSFVAPENFEYGRNNILYIYDISEDKKSAVETTVDEHHRFSFWDYDSNAIYFRAGIGLHFQLFSVNIYTSETKQLSKYSGQVFISRDDRTGHFTVQYSNPKKSRDIYFVRTLGDLPNPSRWTRITDLNPQVSSLSLGQYEAIQWKSTDGMSVEGLLILPDGRKEGQRYPLITQIHGGPASAYMKNFSGSHSTYVHVLTGAGYAVFQPNYRGSTNYGEEFRREIAGDYFRQAYDDIITGIDYLIDLGIAHPDSLGMMGWSAGGHWTNWTMTQTDRFKAFSTGAGAVNWISLFAQTDVQFTREFYFDGTPYENWEHYVEVSPLRYISDATTPTLIHFGENDTRIPKGQGDELYMALIQHDVPVEYIVYPNMPHGINRPKYQLIKMISEFNWFEKWIRGQKKWIDWEKVLEYVE